MSRENSEDDRTEAPSEPGERAAPAPITPGDEPSALERGARIFERLRRRPPEGGAG